MRLCRECRFYRPFRPITQLLVRELGLDNRNVLSELVSMMQDERKKQDAEAKLLPVIRRDGSDRWDVRPSMADYCVADENAFVVPGIRNQHGDCPSFRQKRKEEEKKGDVEARDDEVEEATPGSQPCARCAHRVQPDGLAQDARATELWNASAITGAVFGKDSGTAAKGMEDVRETAGVRKSFEAAQIYYAGKISFRPPRYIAYCREYSHGPDFIPCMVQNPHDSCHKFTRAEPAPAGVERRVP
jgi:hypothetical protein